MNNPGRTFLAVAILFVAATVASTPKLDRALDEAISRMWVVVDMKQDWKVIYPAAN